MHILTKILVVVVSLLVAALVPLAAVSSTNQSVFKKQAADAQAAMKTRDAESAVAKDAYNASLAALQAGELVLQLHARLLGGEVLRARGLDVLAHGVDELGLQRVVGAGGVQLALEVGDLQAGALGLALLVGADLHFLVALHRGGAQLGLEAGGLGLQCG
ncbi:MAG: hypothetical protein ACKOJI_10675, partial [Phycisphaerales bacterium]